jgi:translocation and assembly module TamB
VDIGLFGLIKQNINVNRLSLTDFYANIERIGADTAFNYDFVLEAFASDDPKTPSQEDTVINGWQISVGTIDLEGIRLNYNDELMGNHFTINLGGLDVEMDEIDLDLNAYSVKSIRLRDTESSFRISKFVTDTVTTDDPSDLELVIKEIEVENVRFAYINEATGQNLDLHVGELLAMAREFSLLRQEIAFSEINLNNSQVSYQQNTIPVEDSLMMAQHARVAEEEEETEPWHVVADNILLSGNTIRYDDNYHERQNGGIDFNHILLESLYLEATDFTYRGTDILADIDQLSFQEQSGFALHEFRTQLAFTDREATLADLYINTGNSLIQNHFSLQYPSLQALSENLGQTQLSLGLRDSHIGFKDILFFAPDMVQMPPIQGNENLVLYAQASFSGLINDLSIDRFNLNTLSNTSLDARGRITGLPDMDKAFFDLTRFRLVTTANDLHNLVVPDSIVQQYQLPERLALTATFRGTMEKFASQAILNTSLGDIRAEIDMNPEERYAGDIEINDLQLGTIMRDDTLYGPVSLNLNFQGRGFAMEEMSTSIDLIVKEAMLNQYKYEGLAVQGRIEEAVFNGFMQYEDSNLHFDFTGSFSLDLDTPKYDMTLDILAANLRKLNITNEEIAFRGALVVDISGNHINNINGDIGIRDVLIVKDRETYRIDSLLFASITGDRHTNITIDSDILTASFDGTIYLTDLAPVLTRHLNQYYTFGEPILVDTLLEQNFDFQILLHNPEILTEVLVPGIERFVPGHITGSYNSRQNHLNIDILIPQLVYDNYTLDTLTFYVDSDPDFLNFGSSISRFALGAFEVTNLAVVGQVHDDVIESRLQITDQNFMEQYSIGGIFTSLEDGYRIHMDPAQLILNYNNWGLPEDNFIELGPKPVFVNNLILTRNNESLSINTVIGDQADSVLNVEFTNFMLETITQLVQSDTTILTGFLNGFINVDQEAPQMVFTSDLNVQDIFLMGFELGNLTVNAESGVNNRINVDASLTGNLNNINLSGYYLPIEETNEINLTVDLQQLSLVSFTGPLQGMLTDPTGMMRGSMQITGSTELPNISGTLLFDQTQFVVDYLNTQFSVDGQRIVFDDNGIRFSQFVITDARGNRGRINGQILTQNYTDFNFDLGFDANNFVVLNTSEENGEFYYGRVVVDLEMQITGSMGLPNVVMEVRVKDQTHLTYVLEDLAPATVDIEGLVEFIVPDKGPDRILAEAAEGSPDDAYVTELTGINLTADVILEQNATMRIIIDPDAGDYLVARANPSSLSLNMDQVGNITLTGTFEIGSGAYQLSFYDIVRRRFDIQSGSQITWTGDPMNAQIDITAIYTVNTSPVGIMPVEGPTRQLPVQALLHIQGSLMRPDITFGLDVSEEATGAIATDLRMRLNQLDEADINRQVFALLILQRFMAENPLEGPGVGLEATARNSVSQILTNQLNRLSRQFGGFDLAFDLQTQEGLEGFETQLDVTLSRTLFDDRLRIMVGGNIEIEGSDQERRTQERTGLGNYIGDIIVEYRLTPTGNLLLKFFREQSYELFYTDLIETGIGIIYNRNFNRFRELLIPSDEVEKVIQDEARK